MDAWLIFLVTELVVLCGQLVHSIWRHVPYLWERLQDNAKKNNKPHKVGHLKKKTCILMAISVHEL